MYYVKQADAAVALLDVPVMHAGVLEHSCFHCPTQPQTGGTARLTGLRRGSPSILIFYLSANRWWGE